MTYLTNLRPAIIVQDARFLQTIENELASAGNVIWIAAAVSAVPGEAPTVTARKQRAQAVRGAFALAQGHGLAGQVIVLVDDVHTSGATAAACARLLKAGGAREVHLLCWARALPRTADD
jgi:predicted amidophosphoribosyltransferase